MEETRAKKHELGRIYWFAFREGEGLCEVYSCLDRSLNKREEERVVKFTT